MEVWPKPWAQLLIGWAQVLRFQAQDRRFFLALLGPNTTTTMAEATIALPLHVIHSATNTHSSSFGPPTGEMQTYLANLTQRAKKDRLKWLKRWAWHKMPDGPYPLYVTGYGWMKAYLIQDEYHAVYVARSDLNLDVELVKVRWSQDGMTIEARSEFPNEELLNVLLDVKIVMEKYDAESNKLQTVHEQILQLSYTEVRTTILKEVENWKKYDTWFNLRIKLEGEQKEQQQKQQQQRPKKAKKASRKTKRRLNFPGPRKKKAKASGSGPKVRVVTALDHANDAQEETNAKIVQTMAAQKVLRSEVEFLSTLQTEPLKVADAIFLGATKEELWTIALELASACRQDDREVIMLKHRDAALKNLSTQYQALLSKAIQANDNVDKLRAQSYGPIEDVDLGPNDKDGPDVQDVLNAAFAAETVFGSIKDAADALVGPNNDAGEGPNKDAGEGPNKDADDGPNKDTGDGPNKDAGAGPIDLTTTPKPFVEQPHFIRSEDPRSSSGYKGIVKDKRGGWRAKWSGKHIGRYPTKSQACQAYYEYCVKNKLIGPK